MVREFPTRFLLFSAEGLQALAAGVPGGGIEDTYDAAVVEFHAGHHLNPEFDQLATRRQGQLPIR